MAGRLEYRRLEELVQVLAGDSQLGFHNLSNVHARRNAQGVQANVKRSSVLQVGHVLFRQNAGDNALVSVAAGHLVAFAKLALVGDKNFNDLVNAGVQVVAFASLKALNVDYYAFDSVRNAKRRVADFLGLFAKD